MLPGSNLARTIARTGFDWQLVDTEHGNIDGIATNACPVCLQMAVFERRLTCRHVL